MLYGSKPPAYYDASGFPVNRRGDLSAARVESDRLTSHRFEFSIRSYREGAAVSSIFIRTISS
jgi:hypothetical protein